MKATIGKKSMSDSQFLYHKVYEDLKTDIISGKYPCKAMLPSERILSQDYGVWRTTVRQALDLLDKEGFIRKHAGVGTQVIYGLNNKEKEDPQSNVIGFFMAGDMSSSLQTEQPYYSDLLYYLDAECNKRGCKFLLTTINSNDDIEKMMSNQFSLIVYLSHNRFEHLHTIREQGIPILLLNEQYQDYQVLCNDQFRAGYLAVQHLLETGHRHIGLISGTAKHYTTKQRMAGCLLALNEFDIKVPTSQDMQIGNWEYESGYKCTLDMFKGRNLSEAPTAIYAFNDMMCIGARRALKELGIKVPQDVSLIGADNIRQLAYTEPNLTTIDMNTRHTAQAIVSCALNGIPSSLAAGTHIITPVDLVVRKTVRNISN